MKTFLITFGAICIPLFFFTLHGQGDFKERLAVYTLDSKAVKYTPYELGNLTRIELSKLNLFDVIDRYDVEYLIKENQLETENCYGKLCLLKLGKVLQVDKILTGNVESYGESIIISLRLIHVNKEEIIQTMTMEFLDLPHLIPEMLAISIQKMFGQLIDEDLLTKLTKEFDYQSSINSPGVERLNLSGPRMGFTLFTGEMAEIFQKPEHEGGYDASPLMFQFGYQFEIKYLNEGDFQALIEFIPLVTGLEQGRFIPSLAFLNGLRSNRHGFEFAFGPSFFLTKKAKGYYDADNIWNLETNWLDRNINEPNPYPIEERLDSRGVLTLETGFVFALGKTFKSGKLNLPVNAYFLPNKEGHRFGLSVGFNIPK